MPKTGARGRSNQRLRTRQDLLQAAGRLLKNGRTPTMDEVADEAMVSRATAYRYFPNLEALLVEAPLDGAVPDPREIFAGDESKDPVERLDRADAALHDMIYRNEAKLRVLLANSLNPVSRAADGDAPLPVRQNRRGPLIEAALAPARGRFTKDAYEKLRAVLSLVLGTESMVVFRDVLPLDETEARRVRSWAIRVLVQAALAESKEKQGSRKPASARKSR